MCNKSFSISSRVDYYQIKVSSIVFHDSLIFFRIFLVSNLHRAFFSTIAESRGEQGKRKLARLLLPTRAAFSSRTACRVRSSAPLFPLTVENWVLFRYNSKYTQFLHLKALISFYLKILHYSFIEIVKPLLHNWSILLVIRRLHYESFFATERWVLQKKRTIARVVLLLLPVNSNTEYRIISLCGYY